MKPNGIKDTPCQGSCEQHKGEIHMVTVEDEKLQKVWQFDYCEEAIAEDKRRGFNVDIL